MCLFNDAELNCVSTNMRWIPELRQLEIGMSTNRYFPAIGTAGLERVCVSGDNLEPWPPPRITPKTLSVMLKLNLIFGTILYNLMQHYPTSGLASSLFCVLL
ncbi:hypothetical protein D3C85_937060 [compost metagenome]